VPDPYLQFENRVDLFQEDSVVGYKNQPDFRGYAQGVILVRTNHLCYRGAEVSRQKAPTTFRILGLGDSVTWGVGVQEDGIYLTILESMLNEPGSPTRRFETVNTAVIGYSLHQELLTLERDGVALSPDVVLLGFVVNDFYPTEDPFFNIHKFHQPAQEHVRRRDYKEPVPARVYTYRLTRSVMRNTWGRLKAWNQPWTPPPVAWPEGSFEARTWPVMQSHFRRIKELANAHGFRVLVLLFPTMSQLRAGTDPRYPQSVVADFLRSKSIDLIDLFDAFRGQWKDAFLDEMHLTRTGHRRVAEKILRYLEEHRWLPEPVVQR
jgi:lysophospholipase L1-like esterase